MMSSEAAALIEAALSVQIIDGDALQELPRLAGERPNIILADPPFNVGKHYGGNVDDARPAGEFRAWLLALARACYGAAAEDATCYWFCPAVHLLGELCLPVLLREAGWQVREKEFLVWYRRNGPGPRYRARGQVWAAMSEFMVMLQKGKGLPAKPSGLPESERQPWYHNVLTVNTVQSNHPGGRFHVCQKPVPLYRLLLEAHQGIRRVLDPTAGSGSSLVACVQLGLDAVGIELVAESAQLCRERVKAALAGVRYKNARQGQRGLFAEAREEPELVGGA